MPDDLAGGSPQRDDAVCKQIVTGALTTVEVGRGTSGRHKHQIAARVDRHRRPCVCGAGAPIAGNRIPTPQEPARSRVERAHGSPLHVDLTIVSDGGAHDDNVIDNCHRRRHLVLAGIDVADALRQVHASTGSETFTWLTAARIQGDQPRIQRGKEDSAPAHRRRSGSLVLPRRNASGNQRFGIVTLQIDLRIVRPTLAAVFGIKSDDAIEWSARVKRAVEQNRSDFEFALRPAVLSIGNIAGMKSPGNLQPGYIALFDLRKRGEARAARIAAIGTPGLSGSRGAEKKNQARCKMDSFHTASWRYSTAYRTQRPAGWDNRLLSRDERANAG